MTCPDCQENTMNTDQARALGCCEDCADRLRATWVNIDRANGDA